MSSYPGYEAEHQSGSAVPVDHDFKGRKTGDENSELSPQAPPRWWPWIIGIACLIALGMQVASLLKIVNASTVHAEFGARVAAWESAGEDRKKALDTWRELQTDVDAEVNRIREDTARQKAENELLKASRDQAVEESTRQQAVLESLKKDSDLAKKDRDASLAEWNRYKADYTRVQSDKTTLDAELVTSRQALSAENAKLAAAKEAYTSQQQLLDNASKRFESIQSQIAQLDGLLASRNDTSTKLQIEQERLLVAQQEREKILAEREKLKADRDGLVKETEDFSRQLSILRTTLKDSQSEADRANDEGKRLEASLAAKQKRIVDLQLEETELTKRYSEMTQTMSSLAGAAADSLKELAEKSAAVRRSIAELEVKKNDDSPPPIPPKTESGDSTGDNGTSGGTQ